MVFPTYTITDLSEFTGEPVAYYTNSANTAIVQASLLFRIATCLDSLPDNSTLAELAKNAILAMAESIYESAKYKSVKFKPFSSETIGSYSYSISLSKIQSGEATGVMWFDLAVEQMGVCELIPGNGAHSSGGIEVFEHDGTFIPGNHAGNERLLSPNDLNDFPNTRFWR